MNFAVRFNGGQRARFGNHDLEGILASALERFSHRLKQVYLYLEDINGPRGGIDKQCRCVLHLRGLPPVVIQDQDESVFALVHRVANRAAYALSQKTDRQTRRTQRTRNHSERLAGLPLSEASQTASIEPDSSPSS